MTNSFFTADRLSDSVTRIAGQANELCYLIEGSERALLIDGLTGAGSLKAFVEELTDKPVTLALTHGHLDHSGAAWEYGTAWLHPDDIPLLYTFSEEARYNHVRARNAVSPVCREDIIPGCNVKTLPLYEGDIFDLGGIFIEAIAVPGHTRGTLVFLDRAARAVYSGDACNANTLLCLPGSASITEYLGALEHFRQYAGDFDVMYGGHGKTAVPVSIIDDGIAMCKRILSGTDEAISVQSMRGAPAFLASARGESWLPQCGGYCNIMYSRDKLYPAQRPVIKDKPII